MYIRVHLIFHIGNIVNSIGMVICFIPEGLPASVTLVLTFVAKRMYKQRVLVKTLATVEAFNYVSVSYHLLVFYSQ
jgi:magnesium-transporting ATPase (P-type)